MKRIFYYLILMLPTMVFINIFVLILTSINMIYLFKIPFKNHDYYDFYHYHTSFIQTYI